MDLYLGGDEIILLGEASVLRKEHPVALFNRGVRGEFKLIRVSPRAWGIRRWELDSMPDQQPVGAA